MTRDQDVTSSLPPPGRAGLRRETARIVVGCLLVILLLATIGACSPADL